mmetsp:Transcript_2013/g.5746  ORF Transcript_2013/g.5746 Transcript_2013/m.5746 type:complete len:211 (+) Transcript_2013:248-880(+)
MICITVLTFTALFPSTTLLPLPLLLSSPFLLLLFSLQSLYPSNDVFGLGSFGLGPHRLQLLSDAICPDLLHFHVHAEISIVPSAVNVVEIRSRVLEQALTYTAPVTTLEWFDGVGSNDARFAEVPLKFQLCAALFQITSLRRRKWNHRILSFADAFGSENNVLLCLLAVEILVPNLPSHCVQRVLRGLCFLHGTRRGFAFFGHRCCETIA